MVYIYVYTHVPILSHSFVLVSKQSSIIYVDAHIGCSSLRVPTEVVWHRTVLSQPVSRPRRPRTSPPPERRHKTS